MDPDPTRRPVPGLNEATQIDDSLRRVYRSAISSFNAEQWVAAAVLSRQALEAIAESLVPESGREESLAGQLVAILDHHDFEQPILDLANTLRRSRGLEDHLDGSMDTDVGLATTMLDLVDCLIEYLFVLPARIRSLGERLAESGDA